jgi:hypothetical protein
VLDRAVVERLLDVEEADLLALVGRPASNDLERPADLLAAGAGPDRPLALADDRLPREPVGLDGSATGSSSESPRPSSSSSEISMPCSVPSFLKSVARLMPYDPSFFDWQEARSG